MADSDDPRTLQEAVKFWSDPQRNNDFLRNVRWPTGVVRCLHCDSNKVTWMEARRKYQCNTCRKQFSMTVGTIFEDSPLGLDKWFVAVWAIANCKNGISSHELARALGVTQKTAWFMLHRIRAARPANVVAQPVLPAGAQGDGRSGDRRSRAVRHEYVAAL